MDRGTMVAITGVFHEFCTLLAKAIWDKSQGAFTDQKARSRLTELRRQLHRAASKDSDWLDLIAGADSIYRCLLLRQLEPFALSMLSQQSLVGFAVLIVDDGEIRDRTDLTDPAHSVSLANRIYFLRAWPGSAVVLVGRLADGKMVKLAEKLVSAEGS